MTALTLTKMPPFEYCKLFCKVQSELKPPFFIGSQLRGAFGWALKELSTSLLMSFSARKMPIIAIALTLRLGKTPMNSAFISLAKPNKMLSLPC